jgi:glyoxylase-like metal-dependent hydrolase (beta-lactamase superfamily II)
MREFIPVDGNTQRLDGGAMFGNAPRAVWENWLRPDEQNRVPLACRALLVREPGRNVLFETGVGAFFAPKMRGRFGMEESRHVLLDSLARLGLTDADIDVIVLSHLHFDHAGGLLTAYESGREPELLFPKAKFLVGWSAWERALEPHPRDRASFIPELPGLLRRSGRLEIVARGHSATLGPGFAFHRSDGHTPGMLVSEIESDEGPVVFAADLIPGRSWIHVPITMGYDRYAELLIDEKRALLEGLVLRNGRIFFTHDPEVAMVRLSRDETGRFYGAPLT